MQMDDGASSSSSISSPPTSPQNRQFADTIHVSRPPYSNQNSGEGVSTLASATSAQTSLAANSAAHNANAQTSKQVNNHANGTVPEKPKRQRRKKLGPDGKPLVDDKPKEKKPRKPREPKDKNAPTTSRSKKQKTEIKSEHTIPSYHAPTQMRQPTITEMAAGFPTADSLAAATPSPLKHRVASLVSVTLMFSLRRVQGSREDYKLHLDLKQACYHGETANLLSRRTWSGQVFHQYTTPQIPPLHDPSRADKIMIR